MLVSNGQALCYYRHSTFHFAGYFSTLSAVVHFCLMRSRNLLALVIHVTVPSIKP